jgi:hypothetical protein
MYVYPRWDPTTGELITAETVKVPASHRYLYRHLLDNHYIVPINKTTPAYRAIDSDQVLRQIQSGDPAWVSQVPHAVAEEIKQKHLFGWTSRPDGEPEIRTPDADESSQR